jgi:hypothetical protein
VSPSGRSRGGLDQYPHSRGVDERDRGEIEHEKPRVVVFSDGCRQLRDGGEIQLAADHDRCHPIVALDGDLEGRVGLVPRGHA